MKNIVMGRKGYFMITVRSINERDKTLKNMYLPKNRALKNI